MGKIKQDRVNGRDAEVWKQVQESINGRLLMGTEADYLNEDGKIDYDTLLDKFDKIKKACDKRLAKVSTMAMKKTADRKHKVLDRQLGLLHN